VDRRKRKSYSPEFNVEAVKLIIHNGYSIADGVFTVDSAWRIMSFNKAAEHITGIPRERAVGRLCYEVFRAKACETDCVLRQTIKTGKPIRNMPIYIVRTDKKRIPIGVSTTLLRNEAGEVIGGVETFRFNDVRLAWKRTRA